MISQEILKQTPLYEEHLRFKAKMVGFGGWDMPLQYEGILAEYEATRRQVTVFDTCHMGEFLIQGDAHKSGLDRIVTSRLSDMPLKSCRYGTALNPQGGTIDDLIIYRIAPEDWMIVVNAATIEKDAAHFLEHLTKQATFTNISFKTGKLDIQGPVSREILKEIVPGIQKLDYYTFDYFKVLGENVIVSRTGYTGELGYEIYFPWERTPDLWREIFKNSKVNPAGLGVRDVLRIEMGYSLYGHELDETISPLEAGLEKFVDFKKDFIGREALLAQKKNGVPRKIVYFTSLTRRTPRNGYHIYTPALQEAGSVTSGTFSPGLQKGIGIGFLSMDGAKSAEDFLLAPPPQLHATTQQKAGVGDEKNKIEVRLTKRPFYKSGSLKS